MLGLPKSCKINKQLPKKVVFDKFKPGTAEKKLFDEQVSRLAFIAEISPQTVNIPAGGNTFAVFVILVTLKTADCDKRNIALLAKLIEQRMLFILQHHDFVRLAAYHAGRAFISDPKPLGEWKLDLKGLDLNAVWENIVAQAADIDLAGGDNLDENIRTKERREKVAKQIAVLEKKALHERQSRRKWDIVEKIRRLKKELKGEIHNEKA